MINMLPEVNNKFPGIFTQKGILRKQAPKKYKCECGNSFSTLTTTFRSPMMTFGSPVCKSCGKRAAENVEYNIWTRMNNGQIEQEDYILNVVQEKGFIQNEELQELMKERFPKESNALGMLVYFGYLTVDERKRDLWGVIEYRINPKKRLSERYELIR